MSCTRSLLLAIAFVMICSSMLILTVTPAQAVDVQLTWNAPTTNANGTTLTDLAGYKVFLRLANQTFGAGIDVGKTTTYKMSGLTTGVVYYFAVKAYDTAKNESAFSTEACLLCSLQTNLVGAYSFNEGSGTKVTDLSGRNNHGTISGATWTSSGRYGKALFFDGSNDWVTIADAASLDLTSGMTLEAWVYPTVTPSGWRTLIMKEKSGGAVYYLDANSDQNRPVVGGLFSSGTQKLYGGSRLTSYTWTHLAATYNGSTQRLYVNGVQVAYRNQTGSMQTSGGVLRIGGNGVTGWGHFFRGRIDEVRIYNRALTALEIQADKDLPLSLPLLATSALLADNNGSAFTGETDQGGAAIGLASVRPEVQRSANRTSSGSHSQVLATAAELLTSAQLDVGEVAVDQSWKRVTLRQPFIDPVVIAKSVSSREAEPAVVRVRHVEPTGFEISLQSWDESSQPLVAETVGYLVIERGRFHLGDGNFVESGTIDADPTYPVHSIAFSQPFHTAPVVMTSIITVEDTMAVTSRPARVRRDGMQLQLQSQGLSSHHDALQRVSYIAWAPSTGTLDGLVFEVNTARRISRQQFQTIPYRQSFATPPVFVADIQSSRGGSPINVRWDQKDMEGIDVKIDDVVDLAVEGETIQYSDVIGYILIQSPPSP
jgi:concanavalin A-like lectin/glucanase superfamily protein/fibronectin type III domain protein